jgi:hypothetical protein
MYGAERSACSPTFAPGNYSIWITAAASGYADWTQNTADTNSGNYVWIPRGIAVNINPNRPFYGLVTAIGLTPSSSLSDLAIFDPKSGVLDHQNTLAKNKN